MRQVIALALVPMIAAIPAMAAPGVTTASVNFRSGPGTNFSSIRTLPASTDVDIGECEESGNWCAVTVKGRSGFVSGRYLQESKDPEGWPRAYDTGKGRMVLFQPQFTEWTDFKMIEALVAAQYLKAPDANPVFGVIGLKGATSYDEDSGEIVISDISVTQLNFSGLSRDDLKALALETGKLLPTGPITVTEARVTASLAEQKRMTDVAGLKADPPRIMVSTTPAILVQTDGEAAYAPVKGRAGLSFVANTNWDLFRIDEGGALYLRDDTHWLTASAIGGPWTAVTALPPLFQDLPAEDWADARGAVPPEAYQGGKVPKVFTTDTPAEMILFEGEPALQDVPKTSLQWASNTEADVFSTRPGSNGTCFCPAAGSVLRNWTDHGHSPRPICQPTSRTFPRTRRTTPCARPCPARRRPRRRVSRPAFPPRPGSRRARSRRTVAYAGDALFAPIEATDLSYATNTTDTMIKVGEQYFLLQDGVWFVSGSPNGPWQLAREVPDAIYAIPPSSPVYNATYVRVYDTEPDAVWYGYTMGYLSGYLGLGHLCLRHRLGLSAVLVQLAGLRLPDLLPAAGHLGDRSLLQPDPGHVRPLWLHVRALPGDCGSTVLESGNRHLRPRRRGLGPARIGRFRRSLQPAHGRRRICRRRPQCVWRVEVRRGPARVRVGTGDGAGQRGRRLGAALEHVERAGLHSRGAARRSLCRARRQRLSQHRRRMAALRRGLARRRPAEGSGASRAQRRTRGPVAGRTRAAAGAWGRRGA